MSLASVPDHIRQFMAQNENVEMVLALVPTSRLIDVLRTRSDAPLAILNKAAAPVSPVTKVRIVAEWNEAAEHIGLPKLCVIGDYQYACCLTESSVVDTVEDPSASTRWENSWRPALRALAILNACSVKLRIDSLKKYAAYGKVPADLVLSTNPHNMPIANEYDYYSAPPSPQHARVLHALLGVASEVEELVGGILTKYQPYLSGPANTLELDTTNIGEEIGDICWYLALICNALGLSLETILTTNLEKLRLRYVAKKKGQESAALLGFASPGGQAASSFTPEAAINRNVQSERELLEASLQAPPATVADLKFTSLPVHNDPVEVDPNKFCSFCDKKGHLWEACPERIGTAGKAAPLIGTPLDEEEEELPPEPVACKHTGQTNRDGSRTCTKCGKKLKANGDKRYGL